MSRGTLARAPARVERGPLAAAEAAWLLVLPVAAVAIAAVLVLGPPLGRALFTGAPVTPLPGAVTLFRPEATEQARYLVVLGAPVLLVAAMLLSARRGLVVRRTAVRRTVLGLELLAVAFAVVCLAVQRSTVFGRPYTGILGTSPRTVYFTLPTLAFGAAFAAGLVAVVRDGRLRAKLAPLLRESRRRRWIAAGVALAVVCVSVLPQVNLETTIAAANPNTAFHVQFTFDEASAVLNGRSPLVDFAGQYGSLWPYAFALVMAILGASLGVFTTATASVTALATLAIYAVLRRLLRSAVAALLVFLPLLASGFFMMNGTLGRRYSLVTLLSMWPMRLAGPFFLLWLTARHLDGARPRRSWPLFALGALVILNNGDFGIAAVGATLAALLWSRRPPLREAGRLAAEAAAGLAAGGALVAILLLGRTGSLPHLGLLFRFARLYAVSGFDMFPIKPLVGVSTIVFLTYVAAIATATVRALEREEDRLLTGLLAWSGIFGLGIGSYYMGRSHPEVLINMFPAWGLSVALLAVAVVRGLPARGARLPSPAGALCLAGVGVLACSLAQTPSPVAEAERLLGSRGAIYRIGEEFVAERTSHGERVLILSEVGHHIALDVHVQDVDPFTGQSAMPTVEQVSEAVAALRHAGGRKVFVPPEREWKGVPAVLRGLGFRRVAVDPVTSSLEYEDAGAGRPG